MSEWASRARRRVNANVRTAVGVGLIALLPVTMLPQAAWADPPARVKVELPDIPEVRSVEGDDSDASFTVPAPPDTQREYELEAARTVLPTGGRGEVVVQNSAPVAAATAQSRTSATTLASKPVKVGALPVYLAPATDTAATGSGGTAKSRAAVQEPPASTTWQVTVSSRAETEDAGIDGLLMKLQPIAGTAAPVSVNVDYSTFEQLYGADWGSRLHVVRLPDCFLTTPDEDGCSDPIDLESDNNLDTDRVTATVDPATPATQDEIPDDQDDTPELPEDPNQDSETPEEEDTSVPGDGADAAQLKRTVTSKAASTSPAAAASTNGSPSGSATAPQKTAKLAAAAGSGAVVLAVTGGGASSSGDYAATTLSPSGKWTAGASGGGMSWTYPLQVPPVATALKPDITFGYSSQDVDGRTSVTNNQASWIGDGWNYHPGFIERQFRSCTDDRYENAAKKKANNAKHKTEDLCWPRNSVDTSLVMSLNGSNVPLVKDRKANRWRLASDNGTLVDRKLGAENGDKGGEGTDRGENWVVTTPDGTRYHFGMHRLPGWSDGKATTNSTFTVPVFGNHPGEPCRKAKFSESACEQAWRWNLDYVEDINGNAMAVYYDREENHYAKNRKSKTPVSYHRGGNPLRIEYGLRSDSAYSRPAPARVVFDLEERCQNDDSFDCEPEKFTKKGEDAKHWADSPVDTYCGPRSETSKKKKCLVTAPTFWTRQRLDTVTTEVAETPGANTYRPVDKWQLTQKFLATRYDTNPPLWLESIQRTGYAANKTAATLPPVVFHANVDPMPNRVSKTTDDRPPFERLRIGSIYTETGSSTKVTYSKPCDPDDPKPKPESNGTRCYPVYFSPGGDEAKKPKIDWFNKYVVDRIDEIDHVGNAPAIVTNYEYHNAAWAKDDNEYTKSKERTYSEWRGYARVRTRVGDGTDGAKQSLQETRYFRGLSGKVVEDSTGWAIAKDHEALQGQVAETVTYEDASATEVTTRTVSKPFVRRTARQSRPVLPHPEKETPAETPDAAAYQSAQRETVTVKRTSTGNRTLRSKVTYHPTHAVPVQVEDVGDAKTPGDEKCTLTSYATAAGAYRLGLVASERTTATTCATAKAGPVPAEDIVSDTRTYYDGKPLGTAGKGMATKKETITGDGTGYEATEQSKYDDLGRAEDVWNADNQKTHTTYAAGYGAPTTIDVTNPLGHKTTTSFETGRGLAVSKTDANGRLTRLEHDPLGRLTKVWMPGRSGGGQSPNIEYTYAVSDQQKKTPTVVTSRTLRDDGSYGVSKTFYDGLLRTRQVQAEAVGGGGRMVSETFYNSAGTVRRVNDKYSVSGTLTDDLFMPTTSTVIPSWTETNYDGLGRQTEVATFHGDVKPAYTTQTTYKDEQTTVIPPHGGVSTRTTTDIHGRVATIEQFTNADRTQANTTEYKYNARGNRIRITDAENNVWTYKYDARGQQTEVNDPDKGSTTATYDNSGRTVTTTTDDEGDDEGNVLFNVYDALGRKREQREGNNTGRLRVKWDYDNLAKGLQTSSTRYEKTPAGEAAYVNTITGYDAENRPTGRRITIPEAAGAVKGEYAYTYTYTPTGKPDTVTLPAAGGLRSEKLIMRYTPDGQALTTSGLDWYVTDAVYSPYGEVLRTTAGPAPTRVWTTNFYDEHTRRLTRTVNDKEAVGNGDTNRINDTQYRYDVAGNVLGVAEKLGGGASAATDNQCFRYDKLQQLTKAWTAKSATSCDADPDKDTVGGPDPYWRDYSFDKAGNRDTETLHDAAGDITRTYKYVDGSHKLDHTISKGPGGERINNYSYDGSGNTKTRPQAGATQELKWDHDGRLASVTDPGKGLTSYVYDAAGNRILRRTPTGTTLYLGEAEVTAASNDTVTAERHYSQTGAPTVVRSKTASGETLSVMLADHHNTATAAVRLTTGMPVQRRKLTPYGEDRGQRPQLWPGQRGFVGGAIDDSTGLVHLGAREYDPAIGRFISVDPVIEPMQPSQLQPYAYAYNSPLTFSDPDGLMGFWGQVGNGLRSGWHDFASPYVSMYNGFRTNPGRTSLNMVVGFGEMLTPWGQAKAGWESVKTAGKFANAVYRGDVEGATRVATEQTLTIGSAFVPFGAGRVAAAARAGRGATAASGAKGASLDGSLLSTSASGSGGKLPMTMECVCNMAKKYGIDISDVKVNEPFRVTV